MLKQLALLEKELPLMLEMNEWQSLFIEYEKPHVERVWCQWNEFRVLLHRILPCDEGESFYHPHPWASAMKIQSGIYEMKVGYGEGLITPPTSATCLMTAGSSYEMVDRDAWHSVRPIDEPVISLMLTGKPWGREMPKSPNIRLGILSDEKKESILSFFKNKYKIR